MNMLSGAIINKSQKRVQKEKRKCCFSAAATTISYSVCYKLLCLLIKKVKIHSHALQSISQHFEVLSAVYKGLRAKEECEKLDQNFSCHF